jgi:hypothetical protein
VTDLDHWDWLILAGAAFVAVTSLVRLMLARRDELMKEVKDQLAASKASRSKKGEESEEVSK